MSTNIGRTWRAVRDRLAAAGLPTAALDARLLTRHALAVDEIQLIVRETDPFPSDAEAALEGLVQRRLRGEPVARILGMQEFYGLDFDLNPATLVPRPETEMLVDFSLEALKGHPNPCILDLGTGTGCIPVAILANAPSASAMAVDLSAEALAAARRNAERHGVARRLQLREGGWYGPIPHDARFDLIVSNPPYIRHAEIAELAPEVREHDPSLALDGGGDGLDAYRVIVAGAPSRLAANGVLAVEIGHDQAPAVCALFRVVGFENIETRSDLAGLDRIVKGHNVSV